MRIIEQLVRGETTVVDVLRGYGNLPVYAVLSCRGRHDERDPVLEAAQVGDLIWELRAHDAWTVHYSRGAWPVKSSK